VAKVKHKVNNEFSSERKNFHWNCNYDNLRDFSDAQSQTPNCTAYYAALTIGYFPSCLHNTNHESWLMSGVRNYVISFNFKLLLAPTCRVVRTPRLREDIGLLT
jgi:hypothetical protein